MVNVCTCCRGNQTNTKLKPSAPQVDECLDVNIEDVLNGDDAAEIMIERIATQY